MARPPSPPRTLLVVGLAFLWLLASFAGGYVVGQIDAVAGQRPAIAALRSVAGSLRLNPDQLATPDGALSPDQARSFKVFWEVWGLIDREFYNRAAIEQTKLTYGAIDGLVDSLGDPHTHFSPPGEFKASQDQLQGRFDGVGIQIDLRDDRIRVVAPLEGSPAERAGIRPGDVIIAVDGQDMTNATLDQAVRLIRGPRGTTVTLTVRRDDASEPLTFHLVRAEIKMEIVRIRMQTPEIGYLRVTSFTARSGDEAKEALRRLLESSPRGIILDLRSNPGGYLTAAIDLSSQFVADGVVVYQQSADGKQEPMKTKPGGLATNLPVAVLVNKGSASASEIVAGALRDNGRGVLIGEPTFGKGSVQTVHRLSDGSGIRITTSIWLTPNKAQLEKAGLEPDIPVAQPAGPRDESDPQLEAAISYLQSAIAASRGA